MAPLMQSADETLSASAIKIRFTQHWNRLTGAKASEGPAWPGVANLLVAGTKVEIGIVAVSAPFIEDSGQWHIPLFKSFCWRLLGF